SEMEEAYIRLVSCIFQQAGHVDDSSHQQVISEQLDKFATRWEEMLPSLDDIGVFALAEKLVEANLSHKALKLTTPLVPMHELWASPYVFIHMQCLQQSGQSKTFNEILSRIRGADLSEPLLSLQ